jgi:hypothetical protein
MVDGAHDADVSCGGSARSFLTMATIIFAFSFLGRPALGPLPDQCQTKQTLTLDHPAVESSDRMVRRSWQPLWIATTIPAVLYLLLQNI